MITNTFDINTFDVTISKKKKNAWHVVDRLFDALLVITFVHEIFSLFVRRQQCVNKKIVSLMCDWLTGFYYTFKLISYGK